MSSWGSLSYAWGPVVALAVVGVLALVLRWASGHGHSLVERSPRSGQEHEYGLLVVVAAPATFVEAEVVRRRLAAHGITATLAPTAVGPRVLVFPEDAATARSLLGD